ncbi:MAG: thioredoxin family protein [Maritimibacter sp.]|nr:thioredoxin family protein [Maritimibacter sp.]
MPLLTLLRRFAALALLGLATPTFAEIPIGEDGLHKPDWVRETFLDLRDDLAEANQEGKRLLIIAEQRGCIYCKKMHEEVFPIASIDKLIRENFFVVQINIYGDKEVTDFDGTTLSEKDMAVRWGVIFTPTMLFMPEDVPEDVIAPRGAVAFLPGAFEPRMAHALFTWIKDKAYLTEPQLQRYYVDEYFNVDRDIYAE